MLSIRSAGQCTFLFAVALAGCAVQADEVDDLGVLADDKSDTVLPRTVELEVPAGESKRFRITTAGFVASIVQDGDIDAQLTAKHYDFVHESDTGRAPQLTASADGTVRNWTLTVYNRGDATLEGKLAIDIPRATPEL